MSKALQAIVLVFLISVLVPFCYGVLNPNLNGPIIVYVFTPFKCNGEVNPEIVPQLAEYLAERDIKNIHVLGFFGEGPILPMADRIALVSAWVNQTDRLGLNLYVEVGVMPFPDQLELVKYCSQINVSAITAFPIQIYEAKTQEELIEDYRRLSDAAPNLPLIYDEYSGTDPTIDSAEAFLALIGQVKTFAGGIISISRALDVQAAVFSVYDYQIWVYGDRAIAPSLAINLNGSITNCPNLCPKVALAIADAVKAKNIVLALDLQQQLNRFIQGIIYNQGERIVYSSRSYFKYLRATFFILTGMDLGERLPFERATPAELDQIRCNLVGFEDFINRYCK